MQTGLATLRVPPAGNIHKRIEQIEALWDEFEAQEDREDFERWSFSQLTELENVMATKRYGRSRGPRDGVCAATCSFGRTLPDCACSAAPHRRDLKAKEFSLRRQKAEAERQADEERLRRVQAAAAAEKAEAERAAGGRPRTTSRTWAVPCIGAPGGEGGRRVPSPTARLALSH